VITKLFFESPGLLVAAWVVLQFILIALWSRLRSRATSRLVWAGFVAIPLLLGLSHWVVTPREHVMRLCHALASAVDAGDVQAIDAGLSSDFQAGGMTAPAFLDRVRVTLSRYHIDQPRLRDFRFESQETGEIIAEFSASARIFGPEGAMDGFVSRWRVVCRRMTESWLVTTLDPVPIPPFFFRNLNDVLR